MDEQEKLGQEAKHWRHQKVTARAMLRRHVTFDLVRPVVKVDAPSSHKIAEAAVAAVLIAADHFTREVDEVAFRQEIRNEIDFVKYPNDGGLVGVYFVYHYKTKLASLHLGEIQKKLRALKKPKLEVEGPEPHGVRGLYD